VSDDYLQGEPYWDSAKKIYRQAAEELLKPYPASPLVDFPRLTQLTGGFRPREFSILCGATGVGKTTLLANWSKSLLRQQVSHFVASVETGHTDFVKRVMSAQAGEDWNTGKEVPVEKLKRFHAEHGHVVQSECLNLSLYENRFRVETLMSDIAWMVKNRGAKIAMIDNLNFFMEVTKAADQIVEMDRVIHELIIFCKQIDVHVVMVMHPKKTEHGRVESEFDIKGSSTAVQEAHNVFLFNRAGEDLIDSGLATEFDREIKIAKMRRKGRATGSRLVLKGVDGVLYTEGEVV
jgi:replicative DNA helicase